MLWLKDRHPDFFQELSSSEGLSLADVFNERSESDLPELGLMNSSTVVHLDIEQPEDMLSADTEQSLSADFKARHVSAIR